MSSCLGEVLIPLENITKPTLYSCCAINRMDGGGGEAITHPPPIQRPRGPEERLNLLLNQEESAQGTY